MRYEILVGAILISTGCAADDITDEPVTLAFVSPTPGEAFSRDQLGALGALVAKVDVNVAIAGAPARVGLEVGMLAQPDLDAVGAGIAELPAAGTVALIATAYDSADQPVATTTVEVEVTDPSVADCHGWLDLYGISYTQGPTRSGVADPVTAEVPINGLVYRAVGANNPRSTLFADCKLILSLAQAAPIMRARGVVEVTDYGVYNYRCIGSGTPPNCPSGLSQHAHATAIDIAGVTDTTDEYFSVNDDWVIDPDSEKTCAAATEPGKDQYLHEMICALKSAKVWNIVLTPNYNADHRNHFHVDLTPGSNFIERLAERPHYH